MHNPENDTFELSIIVAISRNNVYQFTVLQSRPIHLGPVTITPTIE